MASPRAPRLAAAAVAALAEHNAGHHHEALGVSGAGSPGGGRDRRESHASAAAGVAAAQLLGECRRRIARLKREVVLQKALAADRRRLPADLLAQLQKLKLVGPSHPPTPVVVIELNSLDGRSMWIEADPTSNVRSLKEQVSSAWNVPMLCQTLTYGGAVLEDETLLGHLCANGANELRVGLAVTLEKAYGQLTPCSLLREKEEALAAIMQLCPHFDASSFSQEDVDSGRPSALTSVFQLLQDGAANVRRAAVEAISHLLPNDREAHAAVRNKLEDANEHVRLAALQALSSMAIAADRLTINAVTTLLQDRLETVREAASIALARMAGNAEDKGHLERALSALAMHGRGEVRCAAVRVLPEVAEPGSPHALDMASYLLEDRDEFVRVEALKTLAKLVPAASLGGAGQGLQPMSPQQKQQLAIQQQLIKEERGRAVSAALECLKQADPAARLAALDVLAGLSQRGEAQSIEGATSALEDSCPELRQAAVSVLRRIAFENDDLAIEGSAARLSSERPEVRIAALEAMQAVATRGNKRVLAAAAAVVTDESSQVRRLAIQLRRSLMVTPKAALYRVVQRATSCRGRRALEASGACGSRQDAFRAAWRR